MNDPTDIWIDEAIEMEDGDTERRIDGLLHIRHACKAYDNWSFRTLTLSTLSLRTINARLLQIDQDGEAAVYRAEIRHNMVLLKSGIKLGIIEGAKQVAA